MVHRRAPPRLSRPIRLVQLRSLRSVEQEDMVEPQSPMRRDN